VVCALTACTSPDGYLALGRGSTVVVATAGESGLLPTYTSLEYIPFSPLVLWGDGANREPGLARAWRSSHDGRRRTYHLRSDVRWHDGQPLTAHDVRFTVDLLNHPDVLGLKGTGIDSVWVVDDSTVTISANRAAYFDDQPIYPRHLLEHLPPEDIWSWEFWMRPVGAGPFRFVRRIPQTLMEFEANPDYFLGEPRIQRLILKFVDEGKIPELLSGNADIVDQADPEDWTQIAGDERFVAVYSIYMSGGGLGLYLNHRHALFADARVRRAVTLAVNRREILGALALPTDVSLYDVPLTGRLARRGRFPEPLPYDPARALEILEEAGWRDSDADGVLDKQGFPARFTLISRSPPRAVLVQEHLRSVGIDAEILDVESGVVWERVLLGEFDAAIHVVQDNTAWYESHFGHDSPTGYDNPHVADLLARTATTTNPDSVDALYEALGEIFRREHPMIFLQPWIGTQIAHRRIRGKEMPLRGNLIRQLDELWVEEP
jgi:peptide/nickel transport system substrate-binding protein